MNDIEEPRGPRTTSAPPADDQPIHLTWRRLDRLASAATLGVVLAAPRSALLTVEMLRPRVPPTTSTPLRPVEASTRRKGDDR